MLRDPFLKELYKPYPITGFEVDCKVSPVHHLVIVYV